MRIRKLPKVSWDIDEYNLEYYGYGDVNVFIDESKKVGEQVICIFRMKDIRKYDNDVCYDETFAILCCDCGDKSGISYLKGLNAGQVVPVKFSGADNPMIPLEWIKGKVWEL